MSEAHTPQLFMRRKNLNDLPELLLSDGFTLRHFADGDEDAWEHIIKTTLFPMKFNEGISNVSFFSPERVWFICHDGTPVSTATAWLYDKNPETTGYVHMVGTLPEWKGRGLGRLISLAVLHQMKREGKQDAVLHTDDFRLPAIHIYFSLGFEPEMNHESHELRWKQVYQELHK